MLSVGRALLNLSLSNRVVCHTYIHPYIHLTIHACDKHWLHSCFSAGFAKMYNLSNDMKTNHSCFHKHCHRWRWSYAQKLACKRTRTHTISSLKHVMLRWQWCKNTNNRKHKTFINNTAIIWKNCIMSYVGNGRGQGHGMNHWETTLYVTRRW